MKTQQWAIIDTRGCVVGTWFCGDHVVPIYQGKKNALKDAKQYSFRTCVVKATAEVLQLQPSKFSSRYSSN